ncbi:hypothetical protein EOM60_01425 [Candidatus Saccharibacteria bacterium]|nr:hypothetical protein [Candidatus Saccharibacteria bacterium]
MISFGDWRYLRRYYKDGRLSFLAGIGLKKIDNTTPDYKRVLAARDSNQDICNPRSTIGSSRFDISAKTLFARAYIEHNTSPWPEKVYKEHLRSWNNFYEEDPSKETYEEFKDSFIVVINSYINQSMDHGASPITVNEETGILRNGAHRVAAAIISNNLINITKEPPTKERAWGADFFRGKLKEKPEFFLDEKYLDAMTIEYVSVFPKNLFAVIVFPVAKGHRTELRAHLEGIGEIVNYKTFKHNELNPEFIIRQLYYGEKWNYEGSKGVSDKAEWCFEGTDSLQVYIIESSLGEEERVREKEHLRSIWGVDKNSIHITDTPDEVNMVARMFFHGPTRQTLRQYHSFTSASLERFNNYRDSLPDNFTERDKFAVESSSVLDFYGLRQAADLDYSSSSDYLIDEADGIERHGTDQLQYYPVSLDEILTDPNNHFFYAGCKIVSLDIIMSMKVNRARLDSGSRSKDLKDIKLIEDYLKVPTTKRLNRSGFKFFR